MIGAMPIEVDAQRQYVEHTAAASALLAQDRIADFLRHGQRARSKGLETTVLALDHQRVAREHRQAGFQVVLRQIGQLLVGDEVGERDLVVGCLEQDPQDL